MRALNLLIAAAALASTACVSDGTDDLPAANVPAGEVPAAAMPAPPVPAMTAEFTAESGTQITGTVDILESADPATAFRVSVNLQNAPAGDHDWHIHHGRCGLKGMPVVVPLTADKDKPALTGPLHVGSDGMTAAEVNVPAAMLTLAQLRSGDYSLHVHEKTGADHGPTIACATL